MKIILKPIAGLLTLLLLCFISCKKEALQIKSEKIYAQANAPRPPGPGINTGVLLTLKPKGKAIFIPVLDITYAATYKIRDKTLTIKVPDLKKDFTYTIISEKELRGDGHSLTLQN